MSIFSEVQQKEIADVARNMQSIKDELLPVVQKMQAEVKQYGGTLGSTADQLSKLEEKYAVNVEKALPSIRQELSELKELVDAVAVKSQGMVGLSPAQKNLTLSFAQELARQSPEHLKSLFADRKSKANFEVSRYDDIAAVLKAGGDLSVAERKYTITPTGTSLTDARDILTTTYLQEIFSEPMRQERIRDYLTVLPVKGSAVRYWQRTDYTSDGRRTNAWSGNNAATVGETVAKPYSTLAGEDKTENIRVLAHLFVISEQLLEDSPLFAAHVNSEGMLGLAEKEDDQIIRGSGTGSDLLGLMTDTAIPELVQSTDSEVGDNIVDFVCRVADSIRYNNHVPDAFICGIGVGTNIMLTKGSDGQYVWGTQYLTGAAKPDVWGVPMIRTSAMSDTEGFMGALRRCVALLDRMSKTLRLSDSHDDIFERNLLAMRIEERIGLMKVRIAGLRRIDFDGVRES